MAEVREGESHPQWWDCKQIIYIWQKFLVSITWKTQEIIYSVNKVIQDEKKHH